MNLTSPSTNKSCFPGKKKTENDSFCKSAKHGSNFVFSVYKEMDSTLSLTIQYNGKEVKELKGEKAITYLEDTFVDTQLFNVKCNLYPTLRERLKLKKK